MYKYVHDGNHPHRTEEGIGFPGSEVIGGYETLDMGTGNIISVLCKRGTYSESLSQLFGLLIIRMIFQDNNRILRVIHNGKSIGNHLCLFLAIMLYCSRRFEE